MKSSELPDPSSVQAEAKQPTIRELQSGLLFCAGSWYGFTFEVFPSSYPKLLRDFKVNYVTSLALAGIAQLVGTSSCKPKGCGFDSQSGHMPRLWVWSLVGWHTRSN